MASVITPHTAPPAARHFRYLRPWRAPCLLMRTMMRTIVSCALLQSATQIAAAGEALPMLRLRLTTTLVCCEKQVTEKNGSALTLDQLVELAINQHPSVGAKRADLEVARAELELARQAFYPTPSVLLQQGRSSNGTVVALQQPLWSGGRLSAGANATSAHAMAADVAITEAQYAIALRVANAYQAWLQAHGRIAAFAASIEQLAGYSERISRRIQGGASAEVDRILVRTRLLQAESDLSSAKAAERAALMQLSQATGHALSGSSLSASASTMTVQFPPNLDKIVAEALERNPSLRRIGLNITTAQYETKQKRAALWPTVSLRAEHQRSTAVDGSGGNDNRLFMVLEYTPGAGLSANSQVNAQLSRTQSLRESAEVTRRDLVERITIEYQDYLSGQSRQQAMQSLLAGSRDVLASYDRLFVAGKRSWLDVVNAARETTQVQLTVADLAAQQVGARYRLRLLASEQPWLNRAPAPAQVDTPFQRLLDTANLRNSP